MTAHVLWLLVKMLALVVFINRYIAGVLIRILRGKKWDETRDDFEPTVTVVIPMFNEGEAIKETLQSLLQTEYPTDKFQIVSQGGGTVDSVNAVEHVSPNGKEFFFDFGTCQG